MADHGCRHMVHQIGRRVIVILRREAPPGNDDRGAGGRKTRVCHVEHGQRAILHHLFRALRDRLELEEANVTIVSDLGVTRVADGLCHPNLLRAPVVVRRVHHARVSVHEHFIRGALLYAVGGSEDPLAVDQRAAADAASVPRLADTNEEGVREGGRDDLAADDPRSASIASWRRRSRRERSEQQDAIRASNAHERQGEVEYTASQPNEESEREEREGEWERQRGGEVGRDERERSDSP
eukprot:scaffold320342_cov28-Tisochrysis_lutea.AAC.1